MRTTRDNAPRFLAALALLWVAALAATGCGEGDPVKTQFNLQIERGNAVGAITRIEVLLDHDGTAFSLPIEADVGAEIVLPHLEPVTLQADQRGAVLVHATAYDASNLEVGAGSTRGTIIPGETLLLTLQFGQFADGDVDAGVEADAAIELPDAALREAQLEITPTSADLGSVVIGGQAMASFTVRNVGEQSAGVLALALAGADATAFAIDPATTCSGAALAPAASCDLTVLFQPSVEGARSATLEVSASPGGALSVPLMGLGLRPGLLALAPGMNDFGGVVTGTSSALQTFTASNSGQVATGAITVALSGTGAARFSIVSNGCMGVMLAPAATCAMTVRFSPTAAGVVNAMLAVSASPGGAATSALTGRGLLPAALVMTPASSDLGTVVQGATSTATFAVVNNGGVASGVPAAALAGAAAGDYAIMASTCTAALAPAARCSITVRFTAATLGARAATLTLTATPGGAPVSTLTANTVAPGALSIAPASRAYGNVLVGATSATQVFTVTNTGGAATGVVAAQLGGSGASQFGVTASTCTAALAPAATCSITARFAPTSAGTRTASLSVSATPGGTASSALSGNGQDPALLVGDATSHAFGVIDVTRSASFTWTLSNTGDVPTGVPALTSTGATTQYSVTNGCTAALAAGASCTVVVRYAPTAAAAHALTVSVTATPGGTVTLAATGSGRALVPLMVTRAGNGAGSVASAPAGISCGVDCSESYVQGTPVTLTATPSTGSTVAWTGCATAIGNTCSVTLAAAASVTATFTLNRYTLTVNASGNAMGAADVVSSPAGISCTGDCSQPYDHGTTVTLTYADAFPGLTTMTWTGCTTATGATCTVTMTATTTVALVATLPVRTLTVTAPRTGSGTGVGTITGTGISCAAGSTGDCTQTFVHGTTVALTRSLSVGGFTWTTCQSPSGATCTVTMTANRTVTGTYRAERLTVTPAPARCYITGTGISCGNGGRTDCTQDFAATAVVTLTVTNVNADWAWFATCPGGTARQTTCTMAMSQARSVAADCGILR
ncbi:MAG: choice-of-anchor D domain-containing protein [Deltaproteobacteria bacterium]|nr:choice-of-anchor D domain-containing protein [Deltaproteobacteria bacterium]